jgi:penicillin-binding protein 1C
LLPDTPNAIVEEYRDYDPQNYSKRYLGPVRVREALGSSLNVPAVFTLSHLGALETFECLGNWGSNFPGSFDAFGAGFILGNAPVRLLELAGAYAGIARGGEVWIPQLTSREACAIIADISLRQPGSPFKLQSVLPYNARVRHVLRSKVCSWRIIFATSAVHPV